MGRQAKLIFGLVVLCFAVAPACSQCETDNPFSYSFLKELRISRDVTKPYADYRAFYLLTEDFEPVVESVFDVESINEVLKLASALSYRYKVPWTHFVDVNALAPAFVADDKELKTACQSMIASLKAMSAGGDVCELHLHGPLNPKLFEFLRSKQKLRIPRSIEQVDPSYRQRRSFFFNSFYRSGYRELVSSLTYGKSLLENSLYDGKQSVLAFRPGGWDHGSTSQDTLLYLHALADAGLTANSGLSTGHFGGEDWRVGNDPGHNLATIKLKEKTLFEVSPTAGPSGYLNPVLPSDLKKLSAAVNDDIAVIVAVYHLGSLQKTRHALEDGTQRSEADLHAERGALEQHFKNVADLAAARVLYPITIRDLLAIISNQ